MKTLFVSAVILSGAFGFGWMRHHEVVALRRQNAELRQSITEIQEYKADSAHLAPATIDTNELNRLRAERSELMKLRSEVGQLRQIAKVEVPRVQEQVETLVAQANQTQKRGPELLAQRAAQQQSALTRDCLAGLTSALRAAAKRNGGRFPNSFAETEMMFNTAAQERRYLAYVLSNMHYLPPWEAKLTGIPFSVSARSFEFIPSGRPRTTNAPPMLLLREVTPRRLPDGRMARYYGFTDGQVKESISRDGDFSEWEQDQGRLSAKP